MISDKNLVISVHERNFLQRGSLKKKQETFEKLYKVEIKPVESVLHAGIFGSITSNDRKAAGRRVYSKRLAGYI